MSEASIQQPTQDLQAALTSEILEGVDSRCPRDDSPSQPQFLAPYQSGSSPSPSPSSSACPSPTPSHLQKSSFGPKGLLPDDDDDDEDWFTPRGGQTRPTGTKPSETGKPVKH